MPKFKKKPVEIEALHFDEMVARTGWSHDTCAAHPWLDKAYDDDVIANIMQGGRSYLRVKTLEGIMLCDVGDFLIRGIKGELYPCKPDIFAATYDPV